ncbi:MAG TPA: ribonuclease R [Candidatus Paceibacterota bacterium]
MSASESRKTNQENHKKNTSLSGVISVTRKGVGYIEHSNLIEDLEIAPDQLGTALNGDTVDATMLDAQKNKRLQGKVVKIIARAKTDFVGTLEQRDNTTILISDDRRMYVPILVENPPQKPLRNTKAVVRFSTWNKGEKEPRGMLIEVLGEKGVNETEMKAIVRSRGFDTDFAKTLEQEAHAIAQQRTIPDQEIKNRRDMRSITTITIDPLDAKDFDDALSIESFPDGTTEVGIHIADVSHYVRPGSVIDKEARKRATSIYLVDRTIPMLPEILSNDVCSLNPHEDKLTYSAVFRLDKNARVLKRWFGKTIIHSDKRFTYEDAQQVLDRGSGELFKELSLLDTLARKLREERFRQGAIDFDQDEIRFVLDKSGKPIKVIKKERLSTNQLIEDFMLLANREVATYFNNLCKNLPASRATFIYRIHDVPDPEKIEELSIFVRAVGYDFSTQGGNVSAKDLNKLFKQIEGKPEEHLIKTATIRSMAKAIYSTKNIGHFGLSFTYYTHFTSPIRRYPDIMVHRILKSHLNNEPLSQQELLAYESLAIQSSRREVEAVEAERESIKLKQVEYMKDHVGESFDGIITGIVDWGLYVEEKETKAEGLIRMASLSDDFYELDKKRYRIVGNKTGKAYTLGDPVRIRLIAAHIEEKTLDWILI